MKMREILQEENGGFSSNRLIFVIGMIWAMSVSTIMTIIFKWSPGEFIAVFTSNSAVFVGLKLGQKPMESKLNKVEKTNQ
jgi:uncharacterized membrane protein